MKRALMFGLTLATCPFFAISSCAQGSYKVEVIGAPTSPDLSKALLDVLEPQGTRLVGDQGPVCEVWLRKSLPLKEAASASADVLYGALSNGALIGVLRFPDQGSDFRGQPIKAGFYTVRYWLTPQDGAHMGVYPSRDAVLLSPVVADTEIDRNLGFADMVKLSRLASGTPHPAFLVMSPVSEGQSLPSVVQDDQGHWNLQLKIQGEGGELMIGITLVGKWEGA